MGRRPPSREVSSARRRARAPHNAAKNATGRDGKHRAVVAICGRYTAACEDRLFGPVMRTAARLLIVA